MTDLDKKHNDEAHNVLEWEELSTFENPYSNIVELEAKDKDFIFNIRFDIDSNTVSLLVLTNKNGYKCKIVKKSKPTTIENAKAQAELFILNLKR